MSLQPGEFEAWAAFRENLPGTRWPGLLVTCARPGCKRTFPVNRNQRYCGHPACRKAREQEKLLAKRAAAAGRRAWRERQLALEQRAAAREKARREQQLAQQLAREQRAAARERARRERQLDAVYMVLSGSSVGETAAAFGVTRQSVWNWMAQYRREQAQERIKAAPVNGPVCAAWIPGSLCGICNHDSCWTVTCMPSLTRPGAS